MEITTAVIIVNPVINDGSTTTIPSGTKREGITIESGKLDPVTTNDTGLAVMQGFPVGANTLDFDKGSVSLNVVQDKELYDVVVSYTDNVEEIVEEIRYPIGGTVINIGPDGDLATAFNTTDAVIILEPGTYEGDYDIKGEGVLVFGAWDQTEGPKSVFNGNLTVSGGFVRMRGVQTNALFTMNANNFSAAFCNFYDAVIKGNGITLIRNNFTGTNVSVPSSSAILLDNVY